MALFNSKKDLQKIISRYVAGQATADEIRFVEEYYLFLNKNENILDSINTDELNQLEEETFKAIQANISIAKKPRVILLYRYAAAVILLILFSTVAYFALNANRFKNTTELTKNKTLDILPGSNKAILTLADGSKVVLDNSTGKNIRDENGLKISKTDDGQLIYTVINSEHLKIKQTIAFNIIQTPKGGQYQINLPDGTKVWLNAASSLKYPEVFVGNDRRVELAGEAYFEVAKNKAMPFHVKSQNQDVEVLGTHFNINAYMDDNTVKTTLLEGRVKISNHKFAEILKPGEQSITLLEENAAIKLIHNVDTEEETAWKNGLFQFNNAKLNTVLKQMERWYDIKIDFTNLPAKRYSGMVPRTAKLSQVINMLEKTGNIQFELLEGRQLRVVQNK